MKRLSNVWGVGKHHRSIVSTSCAPLQAQAALEAAENALPSPDSIKLIVLLLNLRCWEQFPPFRAGFLLPFTCWLLFPASRGLPPVAMTILGTFNPALCQPFHTQSLLS